MKTISPADIRAAHARIAPHIRRTPVVDIESPVAGARVSLKLEQLQHSGSFKARGAFHNLLTRDAPAAGCATASGGNHGAAGVFVPEISSPAKIARIKGYGAAAVVGGAAYDEAQERCDAYVRQSGALKIHPYDAPETVAGAGTVALEWEEDLARLALPPLDTVLVAVGGGGLIAGVAAWFEGRVKVVGVEPEGSRALRAALEAGAPVDVRVNSIAADSLGAKRVGSLPFEIARRFVAEVALVSDAAIVAAQARLWSDYAMVAEPGGAAAFAALMCGANVDLAAFAGKLATPC